MGKEAACKRVHNLELEASSSYMDDGNVQFDFYCIGKQTLQRSSEVCVLAKMRTPLHAVLEWRNVERDKSDKERRQYSVYL
jgi:hypothetical protein